MASSSSSSQCSTLDELLRSWGVGYLADCFKKAEINLTTLVKLDETTARAILTPGGFLNFWEVFQERKGELPTNKRKRIDSVETALDIDLLSDEENDEDETPVSNELVEELKKLFLSTFFGECLLATNYEDRTDCDRNRIAEIIVTEQLRKKKPSGTLDRNLLIQLSKAVEKIFDQEDRFSFYSPYKRINNSVYAAKGKFTNQYYYWRNKGITAGLIDSAHSKGKSVIKTSTLSLSPEENASVKWLNVNLGPVLSVLEHWRVTHAHRMALLKLRGLDAISIPQYFSKFPVLRQPEATLLFKQDYEKLYKGTENNFELNFKKFAQKQLLKLKKIKELRGSWLEKLEEYLETGLGASVCHHFFSCLSHLFNPQVVVKGRKPNNWTANKGEMQMGFLLHVTSETELQKHIACRVEKLSSFKKPLGFTPFPALIGKDLQSIEKCIVIVQPGDMYVVETPQEAMDVTFKAYHALSVEYPPECRAMWLLVQQKLYNVYTDVDDVPPYLIPTMKFFS